MRMLARTTLSFGTTNPDASGASRSAFGLRVGLYDSGDPGLYWSRAVDCVSQITVDPPPGPGAIGKPAAPIPVDYSQSHQGPGQQPVGQALAVRGLRSVLVLQDRRAHRPST